MRIIQTWIYFSLLVTSGRYLWYDVKWIFIPFIYTYALLCCHNLTSTEKLLQGFFYSNRVINDSSQVFLCAVDMPLWFTNDSPQGQFSSRILNLLYKIKISEKDENQNNLWSLSCPSGICVRYLYNIGRCQNMFCFR